MRVNFGVPSNRLEYLLTCSLRMSKLQQIKTKYFEENEYH